MKMERNTTLLETLKAKEEVMEIKRCFDELKDAINYLDKEYSCDDRDLKCPNPDSLAIALTEIEKALDQPKTDKRACQNCNVLQAVIEVIKQNEPPKE